MFLILKVLISSFMIVLITEIAKKYGAVGGLVAALPINILLSLVWLYFEKKDVAFLGEFAHSAFLGLFPTMFFLIVISILFSKNSPFFTTVLAGLGVLVLVVFLQHKFFINI